MNRESEIWQIPDDVFDLMVEILKTPAKDKAEFDVIFAKRIEAVTDRVDPNDANELGLEALVLKLENRYDEAETYYLRALEADPSHANNLGNYAALLHDLKRYFEAETYHLRALEADPSHAKNMGNYAALLHDLNRYIEAENYYLRALEADPFDAINLGKYALLLHDLKRYNEETYYLRALKADPFNAINLGNYAKFKFETGDWDDGKRLLERAEGAKNDQAQSRLEIAFYRYACIDPNDPQPLIPLMSDGQRTTNWPLDNLTRVAIDRGHPEPEFLLALVRVLSEGADIETLDIFPVWQKAKQESSANHSHSSPKGRG